MHITSVQFHAQMQCPLLIELCDTVLLLLDVYYNFQATAENSSLLSSFDLVLKKKTSLSFLTFALFSLTSHCLARICSEHCLDIFITSTSCVCLPPYNVLLIVFLNSRHTSIKTVFGLCMRLKCAGNFRNHLIM